MEFKQSSDILPRVCDHAGHPTPTTTNTGVAQANVTSLQMQRGIDRRVASAAARPNGTGRCEKGGADRVAHAWVEGSERAKQGTGEGESKGTQERRMGGQVFMVVEKSGGAQLHARSPIGRPLNSGGRPHD